MKSLFNYIHMEAGVSSIDVLRFVRGCESRLTLDEL